MLNPGTGTVRGFDAGDRVVATANHLDAEPIGFANGEVGTVVTGGDGSLRVAFTGGESDISGKALADLLHGWAITVHRAQGSEWPAVVAVLPPEAGGDAVPAAGLHRADPGAAAPVDRARRRPGAGPRRAADRSSRRGAPGWGSCCAGPATDAVHHGRLSAPSGR